jgi:hypothetical protein
MKEIENNPRKISEKQLNDLRFFLREFGDLSGITHNVNTDHIISGNQRCKIFDINQCEIEIYTEHKYPTKTGEIKRGWIIWEGEKYFYRAVDWDLEKERKACIIANKAGGVWDFDILVEKFDREMLLECGFETPELIMPEFGALESLEKNGFTNTINGISDIFTITINIEKEHKEAVDEYLKENGKDIIKTKILELAYA